MKSKKLYRVSCSLGNEPRLVTAQLINEQYRAPGATATCWLIRKTDGSTASTSSNGWRFTEEEAWKDHLLLCRNEIDHEKVAIRASRRIIDRMQTEIQRVKRILKSCQQQ